MNKVLADLRVYRSQLDEVIGALDRLARRRGEKRGRPLGKRSAATRKPASAGARRGRKARRKLKSV